jgi:hypothetical protein
MRPVIMHPRLAGARVDQVRASCDRLGARWSVAPVAPRSAGQAPVIVAGLPAGSRVVPSEAIEAAASADEGATLLLLADEPLTLPVVTLQRGKLVVASPTATTTRLEGLLSMLLGATSSAREPGIRERLGTRTWSAERGEISTVTRRGMISAIVALDGRPRPSHDVLSRARAALSISSYAGVAEALGTGFGMIHFSPSPREWVVYWPRPDRPVWIHSPVRLPHVVELGRVAERTPERVVRMPARSGDVALAIGSSSDRSLAEVEKLMTDGGPATFEKLRREMKTPITALVAEVR